MKEFSLPIKYNWELAHKLISLSKDSTSFKYEIGEYIPSEGGVIFHRYLTNDTTQNYIVVDLQNLSLASVWSNISNSPIGASARSVWNGYGNTQAIITQSGVNSGAAFLCETSSNGEKNDWYLPAIQELNKLSCNMLEVSKGLEIAGGSILFARQWSSTESGGDGGTNTALSFNFTLNRTEGSQKSNTNAVRAVRQFSI